MILRKQRERWRRKLHRIRERSFARADAWRLGRTPGRKLFVDAGSNLGQGFRWFSRYFDDRAMVFHLFEPNPNCLTSLHSLRDESSAMVEVFSAGVGTRDGTFKFYGLAATEGGETSQGGSLLKVHNSDRYAADEAAAIDVKVVDFLEYLDRQSREFDAIVVKMDIEGAEIELLEAILERGAQAAIDTLYVEFHAQYQAEPMRSETRRKEIALVARLKASGVRVRIWH